MRKLFILSALLATPLVHAQYVNAYAQVTAIGGATLTVGSVDETVHSFEDGEWVVLMQMQDNVIGGNTTNNVNFGNLSAIQNCGRYEIRQIQSHTESGGLPNTITFTQSPNFTYNINANALVQVITFRQYGNPDFTTVANMSAKKWDGTTGGVLAFFVPGTLTLAHNLDADQDGFRGAGPNAGGSTGCSGNSNWRVTTQNNFADKGEGIYRRTVGSHAAGMAKILNGGGGGNSHNGGGGGGGNYTGGGQGGPGWDGSASGCGPSAGGMGGIALSGSITVGRIFMGGGGGAGEGNNNLSTDGGDGGGIILVKANQVITTGACGLTVSANGEDISFAGNDGGGGGGGGGTIVFEVNSWSVSATCPIAVSANGGDGGDVNNGSVHGGGGGGGQGVIFYSTTAPANVTNETLNGDGGCSATPCSVPAGDGTGSDNAGVQVSLTGPLPIELLEFDAVMIGGEVECTWVTASEVNNDFFTVERSVGNDVWVAVGKRDGAGNSSVKTDYVLKDRAPLRGYSFYRLKQTDFDGAFKYSNIVEVYNDGNGTLIYPNPSNGQVFVSKKDIENYEVIITSSLGQVVSIPGVLEGETVSFDLHDLPPGVYYVLLVRNEHVESNRFILAD